MVRGYEVAKGHYMNVEDEEIEAVQIESTRTIDIDQFVPKNEIDERYIDSPYYLAPDGPVGQEAFAVIRDTSRDVSGPDSCIEANYSQRRLNFSLRSRSM